MAEQNFIPTVFISGANKRHNVSGIDVSYNIAATLLDDEDLMLITSEDEERVYFMAAHSHSFRYDNINKDIDFFVTPLANALPHMPDHQGEGIYIYPMGEFFAVISYRGADKIESFFANLNQIKEYQRKIKLEHDEDLKIIDTSNMTPIKWVGYRTGKIIENKKIVRTTNLFCLLFMFICMSLIVFANIVNGMYSEKTVKFYMTALADIENLVQRVNLSNINQIEKYFNEIQKVGKFANEKDGYISSFVVENNNIYWTIVMPKWVSIDDYKKISNQIFTTQNKENVNYINVSNFNVQN